MMFGGSEVPIKNNYINKDVKPGGKLILNSHHSHFNFDQFV